MPTSDEDTLFDAIRGASNNSSKALERLGYLGNFLGMSQNYTSGAGWLEATMIPMRRLAQRYSSISLDEVKRLIEEKAEEDQSLKNFYNQESSKFNAESSKIDNSIKEINKQIPIVKEYVSKNYRGYKNFNLIRYRFIIRALYGLIRGESQIPAGNVSVSNSIKSICKNYINHFNGKVRSSSISVPGQINYKIAVSDLFFAKFFLKLIESISSCFERSIPEDAQGGGPSGSIESSDDNIFSDKINIESFSVTPNTFSIGQDTEITLKFIFTPKARQNISRYLKECGFPRGRVNNDSVASGKLIKDVNSIIFENNTAPGNQRFSIFFENEGTQKIISSNDRSITIKFKTSNYSGNSGDLIETAFGGSKRVNLKCTGASSASPADDGFLKSLDKIDKIVSNAIGESPLYKCKHKGKTYYYTPAQLVASGGYLKDSSGKKFKPKGGKPASLSRRLK